MVQKTFSLKVVTIDYYTLISLCQWCCSDVNPMYFKGLFNSETQLSKWGRSRGMLLVSYGSGELHPNGTHWSKLLMTLLSTKYNMIDYITLRWLSIIL